MGYRLWLNGKPVSTASEIKSNFDLAALRGYFLAETLIPWLYLHDGEIYAQRLSDTSYEDPLLNIRLQLAFDQPPKVADVHVGFGGENPFVRGSFVGSRQSTLGSQKIGSFRNLKGIATSYRLPTSFSKYRANSYRGSLRTSFRSSFHSSFRSGSNRTTFSSLPSSYKRKGLSSEHITQFGYGLELI